MPKDYVIVFEDEYYTGFHPITLSRPTYTLLAGTKTNIKRIYHHFSEFEILTCCRPVLAEVFQSLRKNSMEDLSDVQFNKLILINGRFIFRSCDSEFIEVLKNSEENVAFVNNGVLVALTLTPKSFKDLLNDLLLLYREGSCKKIIESSNKVERIDMLSFSHIWDPILINPLLIESDYNEYYKDMDSQNDLNDSFKYGSQAIFAGDNVCADAASVIDARRGPVIIERDIEIKPFTYVEGPAFIGKGCKLIGGKITGGCSFGSGCRIGGEVENTIVIANTNKYHEGFIGHAYIGEWVNLGALTTNSDLKNTYSEIRVKQNGTITKTGEIKIGCFIGDHSKTGIGTTLNTGIVIGFSCNLFGGILVMEKEIPSFAWGNDSLRLSCGLNKAVTTAEIVLQRRNCRFDDKQYRLFEHIFIESAMQREMWAKKR